MSRESRSSPLGPNRVWPAGSRASSRASAAVVGAGLSGLACARRLADHGWRVAVFDKARGTGGRMSTRRVDGTSFDHGAQYFTARDPRFQARVEAWREAGVVAEWGGRIQVLGDGPSRSAGRDTRRFVGVPGMSAVCRRLAAGLELVLETRVTSLERAGDGWRLRSAAGGDLRSWNAVVVAVPAPQAAELLDDVAPALARRAAAVPFAPCWAAMVALEEPADLGFDGAFVHGSPLAWVAREGSKPARQEPGTWVLHASAEWSRRHLALDPTTVARQLLQAFGAAVGGLPSRPAYLGAHRWRFALPEPLDEPCLFDPGLALAACGDWCGGPRVEGAYLSGLAAAERLLAATERSGAAGGSG